VSRQRPCDGRIAFSYSSAVVNRFALAFLWLIAVPPSARAQEVVYLVRHAERVDQSSDSPLSAAGEARAQRLATALRDAGLTRIFTTELQRTVQTAAPIAAAAQISATAVPAGSVDRLVSTLQSLGSHDRVLVVGHSNTLPNILTGLGVAASVAIADSEFDNLFVVVSHPGAAPTFLRIRY
jgi:broad specificity phosphatase PhoE